MRRAAPDSSAILVGLLLLGPSVCAQATDFEPRFCNGDCIDLMNQGVQPPPDGLYNQTRGNFIGTVFEPGRLESSDPSARTLRLPEPPPIMTIDNLPNPGARDSGSDIAGPTEPQGGDGLTDSVRSALDANSDPNAAIAELIAARPGQAETITLAAIDLMPARAAVIVAAAVSATPDQAGRILRGSIRRAPEQLAAMISAVLASNPTAAEAVTRTAVETVPDRTAEITLAAVATVPEQAASITATAARAAPARSADAARGAAEGAPSLAAEIAAAAVAATPEAAVEIAAMVSESAPAQAESVATAVSAEVPDQRAAIERVASEAPEEFRMPQVPAFDEPDSDDSPEDPVSFS